MARTKKAISSGLSTCVWYLCDDDTEMWETTCRNAFQFNDEGPKSNGFKFCPYCGKHLIQVVDLPSFDATGADV